MKKILFYILSFLAFNLNTTLLTAQTSERPWTIGLHTGNSQYSGDFGSSLLDFEPFQGFVGLSAGHYLSSAFDIEVRGQKGRHGHWEDDNRTNSFLTDQLHFNAALHYKFLKESNFKPYLKAGLGYSNYSAVDGRGVDDSDFSIPVGIGFDLGLTDALSFNFQTVYGVNFGDDYDGNTIESDNDNFFHHSVGLKLSFSGGPDSDGDGIADSKDACPDIAGLKIFNGCPDTDGDGLADKDDKCPLMAGSPALMGCPDTDLDGIPDNEDYCPDVAGVSANNGCPEISVKDIEVMREALYGIYFDTAKATIKSESNTVLNRVVEVMTQNLYYKLQVDGHTDSAGEAAFNQQLSVDRANSVKRYLVTKGVSANRISTAGYGEAKPVASNDNEEGKALNRRVEFILSY